MRPGTHREMKIITFDVTNFPLQAAIVKTMMGVSISKKNSEDTKAQCNEHLSSPKPEHTTVASGQGGAQWTAGWCGTGQNGMPTIRFAFKKPSLQLPSALWPTVLSNSSEAQTKEPVKTKVGTKHPVDHRFISISSAAHHLDPKRSLFLADDNKHRRP